MGRFRALLVTSALMMAEVVRAGSPVTSPRPLPRPVVSVAIERPTKVIVRYDAKIRPQPRIGITSIVREDAPASVVADIVHEETLASTVPVYVSPRPLPKPGGLGRVIRPIVVTPKKSYRLAAVNPSTASPVGSVCGDRRIKGRHIPAIAAKLPGCGQANPVKLTSIDGVLLSQQSILDCNTARALTTWVHNSAKPAFWSRGGGLKSLSVPSHYSCRTRNSQKGAKISEHGKGHAIDISAFNLKNGTRVTVLDGWRNRRDGRILRRLHKAACGPFSTVLGPNANRFHRDHFHFDTANYHGATYCH